MNACRRDFLLSLSVSLTAAAAFEALPALGQSAAPAPASAAASSATTKTAAPTPDFSGIWAHPYLPGFEPPA